MDNPKYRPNQVAAAAGMPLDKLRAWERRNLIRRETARLYTYRRALQVGIAMSLMAMGARAEFATRVALDFTDIGQGAMPGFAARNPGELFDEGWTVICLYPGEQFEVKNVMPDTAATLLFTPQFANRAEGVILLDVTYLVARLKAALEG